MARWIDLFSLVATTTFFVGTILGILYIAHKMSMRCQSLKTSLETRGINVSSQGVSFKTEKRFDREHYLDATQRGLVKALGAATVGPETHQHTFLHKRSTSPASSTTPEVPVVERKKHHFGAAMHRPHSGGSR